MNKTNLPYLNPYQKQQATLLYYFSSMPYLDKIIERVRALTAFTDQTLDYAVRVERDIAMRSVGWSEGDLAANWSTHAHPMLNDCLRGLLRQKNMRTTEWYDVTGVRGTLTGMSHFSMNWTLPEEQEKFLELSAEAREPAAKLDSTVEHTWTDLDMCATWGQHRQAFPQIPKFRVRTDVEGESGKRPVRTGVYVPQDDPYGTLQFAWIGNADGALGQCETLSELALEYLSVVGRENMWKAPNESLKQANRAEITDKYFDDWCREKKKINFRNSISSRNARAYTIRPCKWYFVELIDGEFEDDQSMRESGAPNIRCVPGEAVPRSGWWYTPAIAGEPGRKYFEKGSTFPDIKNTDWGMVFWYYDAQRQ